MKFTAGALNGLAGFMSNALIILLVVVFMLFEMDDIPAKLRAISTHRNEPSNRPYEISRKIRNYLAIKTLTSFSTGLLIAIWLWIMGVQYAILWGLIAFFNELHSQYWVAYRCCSSSTFCSCRNGLWSCTLDRCGLFNNQFRNWFCG